MKKMEPTELSFQYAGGSMDSNGHVNIIQPTEMP